MSAAELLVHDVDTGAPVRLGGEDSVGLTSAGLGWRGLLLEQQRLEPAETPDGYLPWHVLGVHLSTTRVLEDRDDGRWVRRRLQPGDVTLRPAGLPGRAAWREPVEALNVALDPVELAEATGGGTIARRSAFGPDPVAHGLALALRAEVVAGGASGALFADGLRTALAAHLVARHGAPASTPRAARPLTAAELCRVRECIEVDLTGELRLADLAAVVPLTPQHFARAFRAATGLTPHAYVVELRLQAACARLRRTTATVEEIARATGFADRGHLARRLRARHGLSPAAYRRQAGR